MAILTKEQVARCSGMLLHRWAETPQVRDRIRDAEMRLGVHQAFRVARSWHRSWCHEVFGGDLWAKLVMATGTVNATLLQAVDACSAVRALVPEHLRRAEGIPLHYSGVKLREQGERGIAHRKSEAKVARDSAKVLDIEIRRADRAWARGRSTMTRWQWEDLLKRREARPDVFAMAAAVVLQRRPAAVQVQRDIATCRPLQHARRSLIVRCLAGRGPESRGNRPVATDRLYPATARS
jgi:hypothetical protein